jgi:glycosyltransferase involved in cell wall biosynthesis
MNYRIQLLISKELFASVDLPPASLGQILIKEEKNSFLLLILRLLKYFINIQAIGCDLVVVLGDLPLRVKVPQTLFLQQYNVVSPRVDPDVGLTFKFRLMRFILSRNLRFTSKIIVQTKSLRDGLISSYGSQLGDISVVRHVAPGSDTNLVINSKVTNSRLPLTFFYPASLYDYKNHAVIWSIVPMLEKIRLNVRFDLTIAADQVPEDIRNSPHIRCLGVLSSEDCLNHYADVDALIFPSKLESYGLPLIEALRVARIPVLASDRPYAREACGNLAIYFDPESPADLLEKIKNIVENGLAAITAEDIQSLTPLISWEDMAQQILS